MINNEPFNELVEARQKFLEGAFPEIAELRDALLNLTTSVNTLTQITGTQGSAPLVVPVEQRFHFEIDQTPTIAVG